MKDNYKLLMHGWGNTPEQKRKAAEYNHKYYELHKKDKWGVGTSTRRSSSVEDDSRDKAYYTREKNKWQKEYDFYTDSYNKADMLSGKIDNSDYRANTKKLYMKPYKETETYDKNKAASELKTLKGQKNSDYSHYKASENALETNKKAIETNSNRIKELQKELKTLKTGELNAYDMGNPAIVAQANAEAAAKNKYRIEEVEKSLSNLRDENKKLISEQGNIRLDIRNYKKAYEKSRKQYDFANEAYKQEISVGRLQSIKDFEKKSRTQQINDAKAENEAAKARERQKNRNAQIRAASGTKAYTDVKRKEAARNLAYNTMKEYEAELAAEKNAPLYKKARKFIDGTIEVAMDNAKIGLSKSKKPAETAQAKKDKKKAVNNGKAWVFKHLGIELF